MRARRFASTLLTTFALVALASVARAQSDLPGDCHERCLAEAHAVYEACLIGGGTPEDCAARARNAFATCAAQCEPPTCEDRCANHGQEVYDRCVAAGHDPARCQELANEAEAR